MKLRTEISLKDAPKILSPERLVLLMGSCFSDNIGQRMHEAGWPCVANPCGVVYNPVSIAILLQLALTHRAMRREIVASSVTLRDPSATEEERKWVSWFMSSKAMDTSPEGCVDQVCERLDRLEEALETADALIVTFGTSDVWLLKGTDRAVGNCHRHLAAEFERRRVGIEEVAATWKELIEGLRERNPGLKVIFTVSPRRYLGDGFAENTRQKAVLILACERLCKEVPEAYYFPAYEIFCDDLRDYRFYGKDLVHPGEMGVDYVWEKLQEAYVKK